MVNEEPDSSSLLFDQAVAHHQAGRLDEASAMYCQVLQQCVNHADSLHMLGVIEHQKGEHLRAIETISQAIRLNPRAATYHSNLGLALRALGRIDEAIRAMEQSLEMDAAYHVARKNLAVTLTDADRLEQAEFHLKYVLDANPQDAATHKMMGAALWRQRRLHEAAESYTACVALRPQDPQASNDLGVVLRDLGRLSDAERWLRRAVALGPDNPEIHNNLGLTLVAQGRSVEAIELLQNTNATLPATSSVRNTLGVIFKDLGRLNEAISSFCAALEVAPNHVAAFNNLGDVYNSKGQPEKAVQFLQKAVTIDPGCFEAFNNLGVALKELDRPEEADTCFRKALSLHPTYVPALTNLGNSLIAAGEVDDGIEYFKQGLEIDPNCVAVYYSMASTGRYAFVDEQIRRMRDVLAAPHRSLSDRCLLNFALGVAAERRQEFDVAFTKFRDANKLRTQIHRLCGTEFEPAKHRDSVDRLKSVFDQSYFLTAATSEIQSQLPIFVVGMPRSGTTLVEQILSSHPDIAGAGELPDIERMTKDLSVSRSGTDSGDYPECVPALSPIELNTLAESYLGKLREVGPTAARVVDKMTINFLHLGLIAQMFPGARVVHCTRDARDVCWSCYSHNFASAGLSFAFSLEHLAMFHNLYRQIMDHWSRVLPLPIHELNYETLVDNQESESRRLVDFCGVEWDPQCLDFHQNRRRVKTASALQVREPMFGRSVGRWKNYEAWLGTLIDLLDGL